MRNTFLDIYDYIKINKEIKKLENDKTEVDNKLLKFIKPRKTERSKFIKAREEAIQNSSDINDELNDARRQSSYLSTCILHPFKTTGFEYNPDTDYDKIISETKEKPKTKRKWFFDEFPVEAIEEDNQEEEYVDNRILFTTKEDM